MNRPDVTDKHHRARKPPRPAVARIMGGWWARLLALGLIMLALGPDFRENSPRAWTGRGGGSPVGELGQLDSGTQVAASAADAAVGNAASDAADARRSLEPPANRSRASVGQALLAADFLDRAVAGRGIAFSLPDGRFVRGEVQMLERDAKGILYVQARLSEPAEGQCFFQRQAPLGMMPGPWVGHVRFAGESTAWMVEPGDDDGRSSRFVSRDLDEVVCVNYARAEALAEGEDIQESPATHPTGIPIPLYQSVVPLQSLPGAAGVLYLDFDGEEGPFPGWGSFDAAPSGASNPQVFDVWRRVSEDFLSFNLNVTTDRRVFDVAAPGRRQQIIITPTTTAAPGAAGVAYVGTYNWSESRVCWSFYQTGKPAAEVISHELGHTLGLRHDGRTSPIDAYYSGHGSGVTGWAPIMGVGYYQNLSQWSKGEYLAANNTQDDLNIIANNNNDVGYRADDGGHTLETCRYLEVLANGSVTQEGIIERSDDVDAFRFRSSGGQASLNVTPAGWGPNLDIHADILDAVSQSVVVSNNPDLELAASVSASLPAGEYLLRVRGTGRGDALGDGFTSYGSLGSYLISGTVAGAILADRFAVAENSANGSAVGSVAARNNHGGASLTWSITSGNVGGAFAIHPATGAITVANSAALDYEALSSRWDDPATIELFVAISNPAQPLLDESIRCVVAVSDVNEAPVMADAIFDVVEYAQVGSVVGTVVAVDPDHFDFPTLSVLQGDPGGLFTIDPSSGAIRIATAMQISQDKEFYLTIQAVDQGTPALATTATCTIRVANFPGQAAGITITCDNSYQLYVNGALVGSGDDWQQAGQFQGIALLEGENVIAVKGMDAGGVAGLLAEIVTGGERRGTSSQWKVALEAPANWMDPTFDDSSWQAATDYGAYGVSPWAMNVSGVASDTPARWIWSSDANAHDVAYFRATVTVSSQPANALPVIAQGDWIHVLMNQDASPTPFRLTLDASDANGDTITWAVASPASNGVATAGGTGTNCVIGYVPAPGYSGVDSFVIQAADDFGGSAFITVVVAVRAIEDEVPGLFAEFFDETSALSQLPDLTGRSPDVTRTDAQIHYPSVTTAWAGLPGTMQDTFVSRHRGKIRIDTAGSYTFFLESDDGSRMWLDEVALIDNDGTHGMVEASATVELTPGLWPLRVEFFENTGGAGLILRWAGPGIAKQVVPANVLYLPTTPYAEWASTFPGFTVTDPSADPDGDGMTNQQEFAFGLDPTSASSLNPIVDSGSLRDAGQFSYSRLAASGLTYQIWTSSDLRNWSLDLAAIQTPGAVVGGIQVVAVEFTAVPPPNGRLFVRVAAQ